MVEVRLQCCAQLCDRAHQKTDMGLCGLQSPAERVLCAYTRKLTEPVLDVDMSVSCHLCVSAASPCVFMFGASLCVPMCGASLCVPMCGASLCVPMCGASLCVPMRGASLCVPMWSLPVCAHVWSLPVCSYVEEIYLPACFVPGPFELHI